MIQSELADASGVSRRAIQEIESGSNSPTVQTLEALAGALSIPLVAFFSDEKSPSQKLTGSVSATPIADKVGALELFWRRLPAPVREHLAVAKIDWLSAAPAIGLKPTPAQVQEIKKFSL